MRPENHADKRVRYTRLPIAIKQILVALTRQLVVAQHEFFECSQLPQLGWDGTCEEQTSE